MKKIIAICTECMKYIRRKIESELSRLRSQYPVITISGPRQSGKTSLVKQHFHDMTYVNLEDREERLFARDDPKGFLQRLPRGTIIDEIQNVPEITSWIQVLIDERRHNGMFVLTGSRQFEVMEAVSQSLAGRTAMIKLLPFSIEEIPIGSSIDDLLLKGFYPRIWDQNLNPVEALSDYITTYLERDLRKITQVHNIAAFERFLGLCAGRIGQILNISSLSNDAGISHTTASQWLTVLEASYIIYRLKPYYANFGKRLIKAPKLFFYDVGLAARLLEIEQTSHLRNHPLRGNLFENLIVSEVAKYRFNRNLPDNLFYFRDNKGNEIDLILSVAGMPYPIEIKSGQTLTSDFFKAFVYYDSVFTNSSHKGRGMLVYGGDRSETMGTVTIANIKSLCTELGAIG